MKDIERKLLKLNAQYNVAHAVWIHETDALLEGERRGGFLDEQRRRTFAARDTLNNLAKQIELLLAQLPTTY